MMHKINLPKVGVIVVTYNSRFYIKKCLESILNNNYSNFELLIVDNSSNDKTVSLIRKFFKQTSIIKNDRNLGFGAANNIGIKYLMKKSVSSFYYLIQTQSPPPI